MASDTLRKTLRDISAGCTSATIAGHPCFIRHLSYAHQIGLEDKREEFFQQAKKEGLPTNDEKIVIVKKQGFWSDQKEIELDQARQAINDLVEGKRKNANMPSLVALYVKQIDEAEKTFIAKEMEKRRLLELTCEVFADQSVNDYYIISNLFSDKEMQKPLFTEDEFDWFRDDKVTAITKDYNEAMEGCSERNLKKLAMQGFFQRYFQLAGDDLTAFFGKPICELTNYQVDLLRHGANFRNIYQQHDISTFPKDALEDPDLLIDHANAITKGKQEMADRGANDPHTTVVGMKKEDRIALGVAKNTAPMNEMFKFGR